MFEKYKGMTFAQASERIAKKYPKRDTDTEQAKAFQIEIGRLRQLQEERRAEMEGDDPTQMGNGGKLYNTGGQVDPLATLPLMPVSSIAPQQPIGTISRYVDTVDPLPLPINQPSALDNPTLPKVQMNPAPDIKRRFGDTKVGDYLENNIYAPVAIGKGLEFAAKAFQLADGYDQVQPELNPNASRIQRMMANRTINMDAVRNDALSGYNQGVEQSGNVRSQAVRQVIGQSNANNLTRTMGAASLQEQQANNQYRAEEAQVLNSLGAQEVQARNYAEQLDNQSKLGYQQSLQNMFTSIGNAGQTLTNFRAGIAQQQLIASMLSTDDFKFGKAQDILRKAWTNGELSVDDMIKIKQAQDNGASEDMILQIIKESKSNGNS